ncbi:MAG: hypothetical protein JK586_10790 [Nocardiopsis sp. BM-2018]|nr:MAG: hypothetical protein JK586_10790 [Nocardiopsis sp. BM-2018]
MKHEYGSGFALEIPVVLNGVEWDRQHACGLWMDLIFAVQGVFFWSSQGGSSGLMVNDGGKAESDGTGFR